MLKSLALLTLALLSPLTASADETELVLKPGTDVEVVSSNCAACHSLDYIKMNAPFLSADAWKAEVGKMRKVFGAAIDDDTAAKITTYLATQYGPPA